MFGDTKKKVLIEVDLEDNASSKLQGIGNTVQQTTAKSVPLIGKMAAAFKILIAAAATKKIVQFGAEVAVAGGNLERMRIATEVLAKNVGISTEQIDAWVKGLQDVNTYGTNAYKVVNAFVRTGLVDLVENLERTNKETGKSVKGFDALTLTAKDLGAAMGISSADAIQAVTTSIVKLNDESLRQLGIEVNLVSEYRKMGQALGKNSNELTDVEKRTAILNAIMREGVKVAGTYEATYGTLGKTLMSIKDNWTTTLEIIGASIQPLLEPIATGFLNTIKNIRTYFEENEDDIRNWSEKVVTSFNTVKEAFSEGYAGAATAMKTNWETTAKPALDDMKSSFDDLYVAIGGDEGAIEGIETMGDLLKRASIGWAWIFSVAIEKIANYFKKMADNTAYAIDRLKQWKALIQGTPLPDPSYGGGGGGSFATGGISRGGWATVGEYGPELVKLPKGSHVYSKDDTQGMKNGGDIVVNVNAPVTGVDNLRASIIEAVNEATAKQNRLARYNLL